MLSCYMGFSHRISEIQLELWNSRENSWSTQELGKASLLTWIWDIMESPVLQLDKPE